MVEKIQTCKQLFAYAYLFRYTTGVIKSSENEMIQLPNDVLTCKGYNCNSLSLKTYLGKRLQMSNETTTE